MQHNHKWQAFIGAAFLMATSAIGPGFLTQTAIFTQQLAASFAFVILVSIILDVIVQLNVWRVITVTRKRAQDIANQLCPGLGYFVAFLIFMGGLIFNIGNLGGAGLGLNAVFNLDPKIGAILSALFAVSIFVFKHATRMMDRILPLLGLIVIGITLYVAFSSNPPLGEALKQSIFPETVDYSVILAIVGGTVGGYITYAGGHRLLEAGITGREALPRVMKNACMGIGIATLMRILLFLAALGVISQGMGLGTQNPAAEIFVLSVGTIGYKFFGIVMWGAAISSVIGAAYTSVSFIRTFHPWFDKHNHAITVGFILVSMSIFVWIGQPVTVLVYAGVINGMILPLTLGILLVAANSRKVVGDYRHPLGLTLTGLVVTFVMAYFAIYTLLFAF